MVCVYCQVNFSGDIGKLREVLNEIISNLKSEIEDISEDVLFDLRVILNELLVNAIIHGNKLNPSKRVELTIEADSETILSTVRDEGDGFDYSNLFACGGDFYENILADTGRGLILVNSLADSLSFLGNGNEVSFTKNMSANG